MRWKGTLAATALLGLAATGPLQAACDMPAGKSVSAAMNQQLRHITRPTTLACLPAEDGGQCAIVCTTAAAASDEEVINLLSVMTIFAAENMKKAGLQKFSQLRFADKSLMQRRRYLVLSAASVAELGPLMMQADRAPPGVGPIVLRGVYTEERNPDGK